MESAAKDEKTETKAKIDKFFAKDAEPEVNADQTTEGDKTTEKAETKAKEQEPIKPRLPGLREKLEQRYNEKTQEISDNYKAKNPEKHAKYLEKFNAASDLWDKTFPNPTREAQKKVAARKEKARIQKEHEEKIKDMTEEELAAMEESIPEWKRTALVATESGEPEKKRGVFGRMKDRVKEKVTSTDSFKNFEQSDEYEKLQKLRKEVQEFKGDVKE